MRDKTIFRDGFIVSALSCAGSERTRTGECEWHFKGERRSVRHKTPNKYNAHINFMLFAYMFEYHIIKETIKGFVS
jgi:hypothetical protein